jgi:hypothetical protein
MADFKWSAPAAIVTGLDTGLNSLANNSNAISSAIDNTTNRKLYISVEAYLASVDLSTQTNPAIYIWLIAQIDGTNDEDGGASVNPARQPDIIIPLRVFNGTQRVIIRQSFALPYSFKILLGNRTGAALAASGNTLKYRLFGEESA